MRLLFISDKPAGSFVMRGQQIAACRKDWHAVLAPSRHDLAGADAVVIVKRVALDTLAMIRETGLPIVYDPLDFWPQPKAWWRLSSRAQRIGSRDEAAMLFRDHFATYAPDLILSVTQKMADDLSVLGYPTATIYHHADPRLSDAESYARERDGQAKALLYFGNRAYLREWRAIIDDAAKSAGARFMTLDPSKGGFARPPAANAMIAVRGGRDGCWISRSWKSNVKAATAAQLGLPLIAWPEAAYRETAPEAYWFEDRASLRTAVAEAMSAEARPVQHRFTAETAADAYERIIGELLDGKSVFHTPGPNDVESKPGAQYPSINAE